MTLCTVDFRPRGSQGFYGSGPFEAEFVFVDNGKLVCNVVVNPIQQDPRTGEWRLMINIGTAFGLRLSEALKTTIRRYTKEVTEQLRDMFMEDL